MDSYARLVLKSGRDRSLRNRHPWVFSGAIKSRPKAGDGEIVAIYSNKDELLAYGHYSEKGSLACRIFAFVDQPMVIDKEFWLGKLGNALNYRRSILDFSQTTGYRLIHAEGDGLPGMVLDIYEKVGSLQLRTAGAQTLLPVVEEFLKSKLEIESLFLRTGRKEDGPGRWVFGEAASPVIIENGLKFRVDVEHGQKTGFFLDQRENRAKLKEFAAGRRILNAFSYSGGFSVYGLAGEAREVHSVDISASAAAEAKANVDLNFGADAPHEAIQADCFKFLKEMEKDRYDLIVLDPPAFTKHKSTVDKAARGYKEINLKAIQKIASEGFLFTYSCSQHISKDLFRKIVFGAAADAGREVRVVCQFSQSPDHPVDIFHPEGEYLKGLLLQIV